MSKEFDLLIFICRAQPLHKGHENVILHSLSRADKVLVLVGSTNRARSIRNPFTFEERKGMIHSVFRHPESTGQLVVRSINDFMYNDTAWIAAVQKVVAEETVYTGEGKRRTKPKIGLVGYAKDYTSYYLKLFTNAWDAVNLSEQYALFNSTDIRENYFRKAPILPHSICSEPVVDFLEKFMYEPEFKWLVEETECIRKYKAIWAASPFPPTFLTVDAVVVQSGHILLVKRKDPPGKGLWALPGGFLETTETLLESVVRELKEETTISDDRGKSGRIEEIPPGVLQSWVAKDKVFDDPDRSARGRTVTRAFLFECPSREQLLIVKGSDDAEDAKWFKIGTTPAKMFFEDHYFIMQNMLGLTME